MKIRILKSGKVTDAVRNDLTHGEALWFDADPHRPLDVQIGEHPPHLVVLGEDSPFTAADVRSASRDRDDVMPVLSLRPDPAADLCATGGDTDLSRLEAALRMAKLRRAADLQQDGPEESSRARQRMTLRLEDEYRRARRDGGFVSLIVLSLEDLAPLDEAFGDSAVEGFVQTVTDSLRRSLREGDLLFRSGEREFVVILPETRRAGAMTVAERLRTRAAGLVAKPQSGDDRPALPVKARPALGVAEAPSPEVRSANELLTRARASLGASGA